MTRRTFTSSLALSLGLSRVSAPLLAADGPPLKVGMELTYPPFEMTDDSGKPDGVGVKMAEALAAHLGRPLKIVPMDFSGLIPALKTNSIDLIISSMTATEERRQSIEFSEPYAFTGLALLVGKKSSITSIDDLKKGKHKIVVKSTTTGETWSEKNLPNCSRTAFEAEAACVQEVAQGRAAAFIYDQLSIFKYHQQNAKSTTALLNPFVKESWAIGLPKGDSAVKAKVDEFIKKFRTEGGFQKLAEKFLAEEKRLLDEMKVPFILQ
jgi:polar amino acid transport system substrate-binding protein